MFYIFENNDGRWEIRDIDSLMPYYIKASTEKISNKFQSEHLIGEYIKKTEIYSYLIYMDEYVKTGKIKFENGTTLYHYKNPKGKLYAAAANGYHDKKKTSNILWHLNLENGCWSINKSCYFLSVDMNSIILSDKVFMHIVRTVPLTEYSAFESYNIDMEHKFRSHLPLLKKFIDKAKIELYDKKIQKYQQAIQMYNNLKEQQLDIRPGAIKIKI